MQTIDDIIEMLDRGTDTRLIIERLTLFKDSLKIDSTISKSRDVPLEPVIDESTLGAGVSDSNIAEDDTLVTKMVQYLFRGWMLTQILEGVETEHVCPLCAKIL